MCEQYQTIFEINLRAEKAFHNVQKLVGTNANIAAFIETPKVEGEIDGRELLVGNSFSIDDQSQFVVYQGNVPTKVDDQVFSGVKGSALRQHVAQARAYVALREQARWASVRLISYLRRGALQLEKEYGMGHELIYFATHSELEHRSVRADLCRMRKEAYTKLQDLEFPKRVASYPLKENTQLQPQGLAPGRARGVLVDTKNIQSTSDDKILYTKQLTPDLTQYFDDVVGIVTQEGGLLSHLAIMAREAHVPVVQTTAQPVLGSHIEIDGDTGEVLKV